MNKKKYEKEIRELQIELTKIQKRIKEKGEKVLIILEGRDAAGKGGAIKTITENLNPRGCRVVALEKPSNVEKTQWYFQRYVAHLPSAGEIVIFDRSWYNRGGVEPVMGYCTKEEEKEFLKEVPEFEKMIINSGIKLIKLYFNVSKKEQAKRFEERKKDPLKQYKISPVDEKAQDMWELYTEAKYRMLKASNKKKREWMIVNSDDKEKARINGIKYIIEKVSNKKYKKDKKILVEGKKEIKRMKKNKDK